MATTAAGTAFTSTQQQAIQARQLNMAARQLVLDNSINMLQSVASETLSGVIPGQVRNYPCRMIGLLKRFWVEVSFTLAQSASETFTRTNAGAANIFSNISFNDTSNYTRINTTGFHANMVATAKQRGPYGAAYTTDTPNGFGSNISTIVAPSSITTAQTVRMFFEVPVAYSDTDLRGAMWAGVVNATMQLSLTINPNLVAVSGADATNSVYQSSTSSVGTLSNFSITVYQNYLDQLPQGQQGPILPPIDLSMIYQMTNTAQGGLVVSQENPIPYANFRTFLSTMITYDNAGTLTAGTNINYFALQAANTLNIEKMDPYMQTLRTRLRFGEDAPTGTYYWDHRDAPIATTQSGNMQMVINPNVVTSAASQFQIGWEYFAMANVITQAGSLQSAA